MTPAMLRRIGYVAFAIALVLAGLWLVEEVAGLVILDDPVPGAIGFGLLGLTCYLVAKRGDEAAKD